MSRKSFLAVLGVITVALTFLQEQFGLTMNAVAVMGALATVSLFILFEAKLDFKRMAAQVGKWKDPKFWLAFLSVLLAAVSKELGLNLPVEAIVAVLTVIMSVLFGIKLRPSAYPLDRQESRGG